VSFLVLLTGAKAHGSLVAHKSRESILLFFFMIRGALDAYEPNWRRRLLKYGVKKALKVAGEYAAWSKILRKPYKAHTEIADNDKKTLSSEMPPKPRTRSSSYLNKASGKRKFRRAMVKLSAVNRFKKAGAAAAERRAKAKFVPMHSTGYVGAFTKPKSKGRPKGATLFDTNGIVLRKETADIKTGSECVYVGHGVPLNTTILNIMRALLRIMMKKGGIDITDWNDTAGFRGFWAMFYTIGNSTITLDVQTTITESQTYLQIADAMTGLLRTTITDADALNPLTFTTSRIRVSTDATSAFVTGYSELNLKNFSIVYDYWSIIKVKNVTLAADASDGDLITNVESQPLRGKVYATKSWSNGFQLYKQQVSGGKPTLQAGVDSGVIAEDALALGYSTGSNNPYGKPPPAYMLSTNKEAKVRINPGELKVDVCKFKTKMQFNTLMNKLIFSVNVNNDDKLRQFGGAHVFAFEREVEIGGSPEAAIRIAYQVDYVMKVRGVAGAQKVAPITDLSG